MKKLLLTLVVTLAFCGSVFSQNYPDSHWPDFHYTWGAQSGICAAFAINGHIYTVEDEGWDQLEVAMFVGDEMRGRDFLDRTNVDDYGDLYPITNATAIGYETPGELVTFKLWDHTAGFLYEECEVTYLGEPLEILTGTDHFEALLDEPYLPIILNFTGGAGGYTLHIDGFEEYTGEANGGYYLIASPVQDAIPGEIAGMTEGEFDLYSFNQSVAEEWINYKAAEEGYNLVSGMGYLYAHETDIDLEFTGTPVEGDEFTVELTYDDAAPHFAGWNLVGNPFAEDDAYITKPFYTMNEVGDGYVSNAAGTAIAPMTGLFVVAEEGEDGLTFTKAPATKTMKLALNLVRNSNVVDRAIVTFGAGQQLPKFQLRSNSTKLYIPMDGEDYAVVSSAEMGEMPVNFKAETSGSYTLAVSSELSFNYLHLIDNKTGVDVDLLANPSYSFEAQTTDYASRFRLVFATGNSDDTFAFYSNGSFVISNEGEAVVQVMDVTGRMLSSEAISGSASINVDGAAGVYMIRLVNGESVKVQKVVVK